MDREISIRRRWKDGMHKKNDLWRTVIAGEGLVIALTWLCYDQMLWVLPLQILLFPVDVVMKKKRKQYRKKQYAQGFRELLQSLLTSLQAGYSLENACALSLQEIRQLYPSSGNPTVIQLEKIVRGISLHASVEQLFMAYARETEVEEIYEFAIILHIVRTTGGNMVETLKNAMEHLQARMEVEEELRVNLSGRLLEKNIMLLMPFGILLYLRCANPAYVECLYGSVSGNVIVTGMLILTMLCFFWTERIMDIEL